MRVAVASVLAITASSIFCTDARAEEERAGSLLWAGAALEAATAGNFALAFTTKVHSSSAATTGLAFGTFAFAGAVGYLAYRLDLPPEPPLVFHGAGWAGLDLFLLGTLIDGRDDRHRMKIGPAAISLGIAGALGGGFLGAWNRTSNSDSVLMAAAPVGFGGGGLFIGGMLVLIGGIDGDKAPSQFATGAVIGLTIGLGVATYYTATHRGESATVTPRAIATMPRLELDGDRRMVSFGGTF